MAVTALTGKTRSGKSGGRGIHTTNLDASATEPHPKKTQNTTSQKNLTGEPFTEVPVNLAEFFRRNVGPKTSGGSRHSLN